MKNLILGLVALFTLAFIVGCAETNPTTGAAAGKDDYQKAPGGAAQSKTEETK